MKIQMRANLVAVKKLGKQTKDNSGMDGLIVMPEVTDNQGIIRFVGPDAALEGVQAGQKIYYGNKRTQIRMNGEDVMVMEVDNIYAVIEESSNEESKEA